MYFQAGISFITLFTSILPLLSIAASEPVQYCKYGAGTGVIDFCMGMLMHHNVTTDSHDLYLSMSVTRSESTPLGWTALGLGEVMEGALMFIVYGDPISSKQPIVSVRKSIGHKQPTLVTREDMNGSDVRVIRADWHPSPSSPNSAVAMVSLVCYSCHLWPGTQISAASTSQPWMWAWNSKQDISDYTYDVHLKMHAHHAGAGGWGIFYVDMSRSINNWHNAPSFPPIRPGVHALGASDNPELSTSYGSAWFKRNPILHLHGMIMGIAFLLLFPVGVLAIRSGRTKAFKYHWIIQVVASGLTLVGFVLGLVLSRQINTVHQVAGISLVTCLGVQSILGWRHHIVFLRLRRRTWLSHSHIWLGRLMMIVGWGNLFTGLLLRGYSGITIGLVGCLVGLEAVGLTAWLLWINIKASREKLAKEPPSDGHKSNGVGYFAVGEEEEEECDTSSSSTNLEDEESRPMIEKA
ncbi:iron reductase domain protein [Hypoxylon trugodes]|uniref:iron reductase domain protein n=1 Tax=Hypoxylon trugodes TaxID=326681 RepID=UPI0021997523|nr:iron reductase domain protein [Hypoxylon trugodes]KAI1384937.1 iron reductase domain protein [Hypoxylon trugodes]